MTTFMAYAPSDSIVVDDYIFTPPRLNPILASKLRFPSPAYFRLFARSEWTMFSLAIACSSLPTADDCRTLPCTGRGMLIERALGQSASVASKSVTGPADGAATDHWEVYDRRRSFPVVVRLRLSLALINLSSRACARLFLQTVLPLLQNVLPNVRPCRCLCN